MFFIPKLACIFNTAHIPCNHVSTASGTGPVPVGWASRKPLEEAPSGDTRALMAFVVAVAGEAAQSGHAGRKLGPGSWAGLSGCAGLPLRRRPAPWCFLGEWHWQRGGQGRLGMGAAGSDRNWEWGFPSSARGCPTLPHPHLGAEAFWCFF